MLPMLFEDSENSLQSITLTGNPFTGAYLPPTFLTKKPLLLEFYCGSCGLKGGIPAWSNNLETLFLDVNSFTKLPFTFITISKQESKMKVLSLAVNSLQDNFDGISPYLAEGLDTLSLHTNPKLYGNAVPTPILPNLRVLHTELTAMAGTLEDLPASLQHLYVGCSQPVCRRTDTVGRMLPRVSGFMPDFTTVTPNLQGLSLDGVDLDWEGKAPAEIGLRNLRHLVFNGIPTLSGTLPSLSGSNKLKTM